MNKEKVRTSFYTNKQTIDECDLRLEVANCKNRSEYINKAIEFYNGYLALESNYTFLGEVLQVSLSSTMKLAEKRLSNQHFKTAVELAKLTKMIAPICDLSSSDLNKLHSICLEEVAKIKDVLIFENEVIKQRGNK